MPPDAGACESCTASKCCPESNACAKDQNFCGPYEACLAACNGDPTCRSHCTIDNPVPSTSSGAVSALSSCLVANCEAECGLTCGAFAGYLSEPAQAAGCEGCLEQKACPHALTCGASTDCDAYWRCVLACPTIDCKEACPLHHAAGYAEFKTLFQDFSGTCATSCGFGSYWACAGNVGYPVPKAQTLTWTNWVYDAFNQMPVSGATLLVCSSNCPCNLTYPMIAQGTTGTDGFFTLSIPVKYDSTGQQQLFCIETHAAGYDTSFFFPGLPFSEPNTSSKDGLGPNVSLGLIVFSASNIQTYVMSLPGGHSQDPARGVIAAGIFDCFANPAADGVLVSIGTNDPLAAPSDPVDAGADAGLSTLTGGRNTAGHAVFFNLEAGSYVVTATPPGFSNPVGKVAVTVAPSTVSQLGVFPSP
jgi:hypothetical protein